MLNKKNNKSLHKQTHVVVVIEDMDGNIFGGYYHKTIGKLCTSNDSVPGTRNTDPNTFVFSYDSNRRIHSPSQFRLSQTSQAYGLTIYTESTNKVLEFGCGDIVIYRDGTGSVSRCAFDYNGIVQPFVETDENGFGRFTVKRLECYRF